MARRCFERMDAEGITGRIAILHVLSDTENADTQGPVWRVAGRSSSQLDRSVSGRSSRTSAIRGAMRLAERSCGSRMRP